MGDRRARIPASEVGDEPRNWNLPFWTEPTHVVETPEDLDGDNDVLMEVAEVETVTPLTADELEAIRQEAYNEGLQQGLEEGREKGEKLGHETGLAQGLKAGHEEGRKEGYDVGKVEGEVEAKGRAEIQRNNLQTQLHGFMQALNATMLSQQEEVEKILPDVIEHLAKAVVTEELSQGSEHIVHLVKQAIAALPVKLKDFTIEINHNDFSFIETALEQKQFSANLQSNEIVEAGGCLIHSEKSLIDFTLSNRWEEVIKDYHQRLQIKESSENNSANESEEKINPQESALTQESEDSEQADTAELETESVEAKVEMEPQGLVDIPDLIEEEYQADTANIADVDEIEADTKLEASEEIKDEPIVDAQDAPEETTAGSVEEAPLPEKNSNDAEQESEPLNQHGQSNKKIDLETSVETEQDIQADTLSPNEESLPDTSAPENETQETPLEAQSSAPENQTAQSDIQPGNVQVNQGEITKGDEEEAP
jgi:flagellar assembly protein FliH